MSMLITGGTGYIGSHTVVELLNAGEEVVIVDNLSNSKRCVLDRIEAITGKRPEFIECDLLDKDLLDKVIPFGMHVYKTTADKNCCIFPFHNNPH